MKNKRLWLIPAAFYAVCCILNLWGCLSDGDLERCVKPALMPLLCLTTFTYLLPRRGEGAALLLCGQLFGFAGDTMLLGKGFVFFAGGIGLFLIGHIFYICLFGGRSWKGLKAWHWALAMTFCLGLTAGLIKGIGVNGTMLAPMGVYGFVLTLLMFSTLAGALRFGGLTWWMLFAGAVLFTFSDALIAVRNFGNLSRFMGGFGVMSTYLAAQTLLAAGGVRLITRQTPRRP
ncbi:MAG: lysoplasmalogenase [Bacteroidales bacterium]|nr:lysoplasmalogenase [Bacteroidales bacterium]